MALPSAPPVAPSVPRWPHPRPARPEVGGPADLVAAGERDASRPSRTSRGAGACTRRSRGAARTPSAGGTRSRSARGRPRRSTCRTARRPGTRGSSPRSPRGAPARARRAGRGAPAVRAVSAGSTARRSGGRVNRVASWSRTPGPRTQPAPVRRPAATRAPGHGGARPALRRTGRRSVRASAAVARRPRRSNPSGRERDERRPQLPGGIQRAPRPASSAEATMRRQRAERLRRAGRSATLSVAYSGHVRTACMLMSAPTLRRTRATSQRRDTDREQRQEGDRREEVALVDARRQHEEADGEDGGRHDEGPAVVADRRARRAPTGSRPRAGSPRRRRAGTGPRNGTLSLDHVRPSRERRVAAGADERPGVEGVDGEVRVAARGARHEPQVARDIEAERERDDVEDDEPDRERRHEADRALRCAVEPCRQRGWRPRAMPRARARPQQVALQQHDGDERDEDDPELRLDERRHRAPWRSRPRCCRG